MGKNFTNKKRHKTLFLMISFLFLLMLTLISGCKDIRIIINEIENGNIHGNGYGDANGKIDEVQTKYNLEENIKVDLIPIFCPSDKCLNSHIDLFKSAKKEINCAFFEFDQLNLSHTLLNLSNRGVIVTLIVDDRYIEEEPLKLLKGQKNIEIYSDAPRAKLMHNKFCIIDNKTILTGSTNPTNNGFFRNNNNFLIISSKLLAKNYLGEFEEMKNGKFGGENKGKNSLYYNNLTLINPNSNQKYLISTYFCPENDCEDMILNELEKAKTSITFASFVLTSNKIEQLLLEKVKNTKNQINIKGLIENRMKNTRGSIFDELNKSFPIYIDTNPGTMHHKVFVIDENTVITGSMNPSASGNAGNDENIIIIKNANLAKQYEREIQGLMNN